MSAQAGVVAEQIEELNQQLPDLLADLPALPTLELLAVIRAARKQLYELEGIVERHAANADGWKRGRFEVAGIFARRTRKSKSVTWLVDDAARAVARAAAVDTETGEVMPDEAKPWVDRAVSALTAAAGIGYFRTSQLERLGIEADEFRHSEPAGYSIEVRVGDEADAA